MDSGASTFWNEETDTHELRWNGQVLVGSRDAVYAVMMALNLGASNGRHLDRSARLYREIRDAVRAYESGYGVS